MKALILSLIVCLSAGLALVPAAMAEKVVLSPSQAAVLPDDESGVAKVALAFDLSGVPSGGNWAVDIAVLDWPVTGVPSNARSEYLAYPLLSSWTEAGVSGGHLPTVSEAEAAAWDVEPRDYQRNGGGFLRFHLTDLVRGWVDRRSTNHGVLVTTEDLSRGTFSTQLAGAQLVIYYGNHGR